ncbi:hypothetical protein [Actinomyces sp. B33]|uniref:hypothetical protein n=1 Tax=Actinomyces sp. B33 TaxID=2942131 RepID=UPI002FEFD2B7
MQQAARVCDKTRFFTLGDRGRPGVLVEFDDTGLVFFRPSERAAEDWISGRFG